MDMGDLVSGLLCASDPDDAVREFVQGPQDNIFESGTFGLNRA
jgi:hypothetical protein